MRLKMVCCLSLGRAFGLDEFKSFQHLKAIFRDFYIALTFLFTFCVKTKSKSQPGSRAMLIKAIKAHELLLGDLCSIRSAPAQMHLEPNLQKT